MRSLTVAQNEVADITFDTVVKTTTCVHMSVTSTVTSTGLIRIDKNLRLRLRHRAFANDQTSLDLLNKIVADWLAENPAAIEAKLERC